MAAKRAQVIHCLRTLLLQRDGGSVADGDLLECYVQSRDEAAFEALVHRHGPMVLGVCHRMLHHSQDAEDAFQATFLLLARKAASVQPRSMVRNWLYGVACRTAQEARRAVRKRHQKEVQVARPIQTVDESRVELLSVLDLELSRLPDRYRAVIVLCDLEGKSQKETARQLELPEGTVASRSSRARTMLAKRLAKRGFVLAGAMLPAILPPGVATALVPPEWVVSTVKAAIPIGAGKAAAGGTVSYTVAALVEEVQKAMFLAKMKTLAVALVLVSVIGTTAAGLVVYQAQPAVRPDPQGSVSPSEPPNSASVEPGDKSVPRPGGDW